MAASNDWSCVNRPSSTGTVTRTTIGSISSPPPSGYVDECICQIDRSNTVRYVIQDASYDVVAIVAPQTQSVASKVIGQYTWDPYGQVLTAEYSGLAATYNKLGHHGLFADRLDAGYTAATLQPGFLTSTHLPARIIYSVRNRTYDPSTQRWLQRDPNATGQVVLDALLIARRASAAPGAVDMEAAHQNGMSLYGYVGSAPLDHSDELGLFFGGILGVLGGSTSAMELQTDWTQDVGDFGMTMIETVQSMFIDRMVDMQMDLEWAADWSASDSDYSRSGQQLMVARSEWHESGGFAVGKAWAWNKNLRHHIATTYGAWGKKLKGYFKNAGLSMNNAANVMPVNWKYHKGRGHADAYHKLVETTLDRRLRGIDPRVDKERYRQTLIDALKELKEIIDSDPTTLRGK